MLSVQDTPTNIYRNSPAAVYLSRLAPGSRRTMLQALNAIADSYSKGKCNAFDFPWHDLRYQDTQVIFAWLQEKYAPATCNKFLAALKRVLKECVRLNLIDSETYFKAVDISSINFQKVPSGRALKAREVSRIVEVCRVDQSNKGIRDLAVLCILRVGLRRAEVVTLNYCDFDVEEGLLEIKGGKGRKDRTVYLPLDELKILEDWLKVRGSHEGALIHPLSKTGRVLHRRMSAQAVLFILNERAAQAGVKKCSPHDWRRTFISELLDAGADIVTVQKLVGHSKPTTTALYDRRGEEAKKKAVNLLPKF